MANLATVARATLCLLCAPFVAGCDGSTPELAQHPDAATDVASVDVATDAGAVTAGPWSAAAGDPGPLPDDVWLKTNTESYNRRWYFATRGGALWVKPNTDQSGQSGVWVQVTLPDELAGHVYEISADDNELIAVGDDRRIWSMTGGLLEPANFSWKTSWGFPVWTGPGQSLPSDTYRWEWSVISPKEDVYWVDAAGNHQPVGAAKVSHIWIVPPGQQQLTYIDPWLPLDFTYGMCRPEQGRLTIENLTASGSTIFVIDRHGDLYTRLFDFDMSGADNVFFKYSYEDQRGATGTPPIQLPTFDWVKQPKIAGQITNLISAHKLGQGAVSRILRVEGVGPSGVNGYWQKDVTELDPSAWTFHETGRPLRGVLLDNPPGGASSDDLGPSTALSFSRNLADLDAIGARADITSPADWAAELGAFDVMCSPTTLRVHVSRDVAFELTLHTTDLIRSKPRAPGLDATPRDFSATLEAPEALLSSLATQPAKVQQFVAKYLAGKRFTAVGLWATPDELVVCPSGPSSAHSCAEPWSFARDP